MAIGSFMPLVGGSSKPIVGTFLGHQMYNPNVEFQAPRDGHLVVMLTMITTGAKGRFGNITVGGVTKGNLLTTPIAGINCGASIIPATSGVKYKTTFTIASYSEVSIAAWLLENLKSETPFDAASDVREEMTTSRSIDVNVASGGFITCIADKWAHNAVTWSGATTRGALSYQGSESAFHGSSDAQPTTSSRTVSISYPAQWAALGGVSWR